MLILLGIIKSKTVHGIKSSKGTHEMTEYNLFEENIISDG